VLYVCVIGSGWSRVVHGVFGVASYVASYASVGSDGGVVLCSGSRIGLLGSVGNGVLRLLAWIRLESEWEGVVHSRVVMRGCSLVSSG